METTQFVGDLTIRQRFIMAGDVYIVLNFDYDAEYDQYKITAKTDETNSLPVELRLPVTTPFATLP